VKVDVRHKLCCIKNQVAADYAFVSDEALLYFSANLIYFPMKKNIVLKRIFHLDKWCIGLFFKYDEKLKELGSKAMDGLDSMAMYLDDKRYSRRTRESYLSMLDFFFRCSSESVYRVFKDALLKAGIKKDVGVHSLLHSYATHLHESGLDIRYIQELLGHKSTRTTEIYTHVSRRNLIAVRSPIEDLDVK
jgi:integrase